jgi:hypothetical protein
MGCRRSLIVASFAAVAAFSLLAAGCGGGGSSGGVASIPSSTNAAATNQRQAMVAFAACMRSHGVQDFPDPPTSSAGGRSFKDAVSRLGAGNPRFPTAERACNHLLPNGGNGSHPDQQTGTQLADELSFARCMRAHGVARFPDPTAQHGLSVEMVQAQGIDVHSPAVLRVVQACLPASHGALTPAKVRQALNNAGR